MIIEGAYTEPGFYVVRVVFRNTGDETAVDYKQLSLRSNNDWIEWRDYLYKHTYGEILRLQLKFLKVFGE